MRLDDALDKRGVASIYRASKTLRRPDHEIAIHGSGTTKWRDARSVYRVSRRSGEEIILYFLFHVRGTSVMYRRSSWLASDGLWKSLIGYW